MTTIGFLFAPEPSAEATQLFDDDMAELGFVMNASRLWAYQPGTVNSLFELMKAALSGAGLSLRERGILVTACASTFGDSYCSLAWGSKLAKWADAETAAAVLRGEDGPLSDAERALADWARKVARYPSGIAPADVQTLRDAGFQDSQIFAITTFVALRIAFSTVNDALGARPDAQFHTTVPAAVLDAVTWGRPIAEPAEPGGVE
jgi:uncharacterized peroxidase-related enzyme